MVKSKIRIVQEWAMPCGHGVKKAIMHGIPIIPFQLSFLYDSSKNMCKKDHLDIILRNKCNFLTLYI